MVWRGFRIDNFPTIVKINSLGIIDYRHAPDGEPQYGYSNESDGGDTLQVRMSALPQDSGLSVVMR